MRHRLKAVFPVLLAIPAACNSGPQTQQEKESWAIADVQIAVKNRLRDPESAEFSGVHAVTHEGEIIVCGYVNATNGFGGKSGQQRFVGAATQVFLEEDGADAVSEAWTMFGC